MGFDDIVISFILSYFAGNIPTLKDTFQKKKDLENRIERCYQHALKLWCRNDDIRKKMSKGLLDTPKKFAQYITSGNSVVVNELINLFKNELRDDELCYNFILENKLDGVLNIVENQTSILDGIKDKTNTILDKIDGYVSIGTGLKQHEPVKGYIRRYCSSNKDQHDFLYYVLQKTRNTLADYITGVVFSDKNKFILYSGGQTGKTTELKNLCWELQSSGLYFPISFEVKTCYNLKVDDLPKVRFYNGKEIVVVIDALDEIKEQKRDELLLTISSYAHDNPDIKMLLSCRGNYRREDVMDDFCELYLMEMTPEDAHTHINNVLGDNYLEQQIYSNNLSEFTKHPFFLNVLIKAYQEHSDLPKNRAEVYKFFIEQSYNSEKKKLSFKDFDTDIDSAINSLERMALVMSLMNRQFLTKKEMEICLGSKEKFQECIRYNIVVFENDQCSFEHNAFREWLAAYYLYKKGIDTAKLFATHPNGKIKPEWYNIIMLWISMHTHQDVQKITQIIEWLKTASLELLIYADQDTLDESTKNSIFKGILLEYKSLGIRLSNLLSDEYKRMLQFGQSSDTVRFIIDELNETKAGTAYYSDLLCLCLFLDWHMLELTSKSLLDDLLLTLETKVRESIKCKPNGELTYIYIENEFFSKRAYVDQFFSLIKDSDNYDAINAMLGLIYRSKAGNEYVDYILSKERFVQDQHEGNTTHAVSRDYVYLSLCSVDSEDGILNILNHNFRDPYYFQSDWDGYSQMIQNLLSKAVVYITNGNQQLPAAIEQSFDVIFGDNYRFHRKEFNTTELLECYRKYYRESNLVNKSKAEFDSTVKDIFSRTTYSRDDVSKIINRTGLWLTTEILDKYYNEFDPTDNNDNRLASLFNRCPYKDVAVVAQRKYDIFFPKPAPSPYQIQKERQFADFRNYEIFKQQILDSLATITASNSKDALAQLRDNETLNDYVVRFIAMQIDCKGVFSSETIIQAINNKDCYDAFFMSVIANTFIYETSASDGLIDEDCSNRCFATGKRIVKSLSDNSYAGKYGEEALQLMMKGYFRVEDEELIPLLSFANVSVTKNEEGKFPVSYTLFDYISDNVAPLKLADSILSLLEQDKTMGDFHLSYCLANYVIEHRIERGYPSLLKIISFGASSAINIAQMMIKADIKVPEIKTLSEKFEDGNKMIIYRCLLNEHKYGNWIREKLETIYQKFENYNKTLALDMLVSLGSLNALNYLISHPEYLTDYREFSYHYDDINAARMLIFILQYYHEHNMNDSFINSSILDSLEQIAVQNNDNLIEVKSALKVLIAQDDYFAYLNRYIIAFENKYYGLNSGINGIYDATRLIGSATSSTIKKDEIKHTISSKSEPIYISYNWENLSSYIVDYFCFVLDTLKIENRRDKKDCHYMDNIKEFMDAIHKGQRIVVVLSRPYLKSKNCMYELTGIMQHGNYEKRIIPVVTDDTIRDPYFYIDLVKYWKEQKEEKQNIVNQMLEVDPECAKPLEAELKEVAQIYEFLGKIKKYIDWTNAESLNSLSITNFKSIIDVINATDNECS